MRVSLYLGLVKFMYLHPSINVQTETEPAPMASNTKTLH